MERWSKATASLRLVAFVAIAFAVCALLTPSLARQPFLIDLRSAYCGARVLASGADPYRFAPLAACERTAVGNAEVVSGPLPPYVFALMAPARELDFPTFAFAYFSGAIVALVVEIWALARLTGLRWWIPAAVVAWPWADAVTQGQISVFAIAALVAAACAARNRRPFAAGVFAALALVQPMFGLAPLLVAMLAGPNRMRLGASIVAALFLAISLAADPAAAWEYAHVALREQGLAEVAAWNQFSVANLAWSLGAGTPQAFALASIAQVACVALAVAAGCIFARRGEPALAFLAAACVSLLAPAYAHSGQLFVAVPLGLVLVVRRERWSRVAALATFVLCAQWFGLRRIGVFDVVALAGARDVTLAVALAFLFASASRAPASVPDRSKRLAALACFGTALAATVAIWALMGHGPAAADSTPFAQIDEPAKPLAATRWGELIRHDAPENARLGQALQKYPIWVAFLTIGVLGLGALQRRDGTLAR